MRSAGTPCLPKKEDLVEATRRDLRVLAAISKSGPELHPATVSMARERSFGSIATLPPAGNLQNHLIRVGTGGERLVVNTGTHRQKHIGKPTRPKT